MARHNPEIYFNVENNNGNGSTLQVIATSGIFTLAYKGAPVGLRTSDYNVNGQFFLYPRSVFIHRGHCQRLADKMNAKFKCDDFTCVEMCTKSAT